MPLQAKEEGGGRGAAGVLKKHATQVLQDRAALYSRDRLYQLKLHIFAGVANCSQ